jgi:hypothetical protein
MLYPVTCPSETSILLSFCFRHAHQVTFLTLEILQHEAFLSAANKDESHKAAWIEAMNRRSPTFLYWDMIRRYERLILIFVRAHRERNFSLYVQVLEKLCPIFFALDHPNYARWAPIHVRDMKSLPDPIKEAFAKEQHWVLSKTTKKFSAIPFDQAHEQENRIIKGSGGAVGLTENPVAFRCVHDVLKLLFYFSVNYNVITYTCNNIHGKQTW